MSHRVHEKGVRDNLKSTRVMLCVGLALSLASVSTAGERSRGGSEGRQAIRSSSVDTTAVRTVDTTPMYQRVAPGVAKIVFGGLEQTVRADGMVSVEELIAEFGSVDAWRYRAKTAGAPVGVGAGGEELPASNVIWQDPGFVGQTYSVVRTPEDRKKVAMWGSTSDAMMFADGMIAEGQPQSIVRTVPTMTGLNGEDIAADGMFRYDN